MKALKIEVNYDGRYASTNSHCLFPLEANGIIFPFIQEFESGVVSLGELEGKHSDCYGDIKTTIIDLSLLSSEELQELIKNSDLKDFISYFEIASDDWYEYLDELKTENPKKLEEIKEKQEELSEKLYIPVEELEFSNVFYSYREILDDYLKLNGFSVLKLQNKDIERAKKLLLENGFNLENGFKLI